MPGDRIGHRVDTDKTRADQILGEALITTRKSLPADRRCAVDPSDGLIEPDNVAGLGKRHTHLPMPIASRMTVCAANAANTTAIT